MGAKSFIPTAVGMLRVRWSLLLMATVQTSWLDILDLILCNAWQEGDTHIGLERRPRLPFFPMTGVPKCSGLVRGSLSSVCGGRNQHSLSTRMQRGRFCVFNASRLPCIKNAPIHKRHFKTTAGGPARYSLHSLQSDALLSGKERNASGSSRRHRQTLQT